MSVPDTLATMEIPSDPAYVATVRVFGSGMGRHFGLDEPAIDDIKLALSEASSLLIRRGGPDSQVRISALRADGRLRFEVVGPALTGPEPADDVTPSSLPAVLGMELILALFEDAELAADGETRIGFSLPLPE